MIGGWCSRLKPEASATPLTPGGVAETYWRNVDLALFGYFSSAVMVDIRYLK